MGNRLRKQRIRKILNSRRNKRFLKSVKRVVRYSRLKAVVKKLYRYNSAAVIRKPSIDWYKKKDVWDFNKDIQYPVNIGFLIKQSKVFSEKKFKSYSKSELVLPKVFSFIDNYTQSFDFLKQLLITLEKGESNKLILDYKDCQRIDVDASIIMDTILVEYKILKEEYSKRGKKRLPGFVIPQNYCLEVEKVLYSIGAFRNLNNLKKNFPDVLPLPVLINSRERADRWNLSELHQTQIVDYIIECLGRLGLSLNIESETGFYKVIGEIMNNAEEHSSMPQRFAIGYFQDIQNSEEEHFGIFNFSIFNFGETIYNKFNPRTCDNQNVVKQMQELSKLFDTNGLFKKTKFTEETLWTLYALQEGVTSTTSKRGNGSIQYIENFFKLKGDMENDNFSKLVLLSGNTRIVFDGTYQITSKSSSEGKGVHKLMTFNKEGSLTVLPDPKFVTFVPQYFPGTIISARILIKCINTNSK